MLKELSRLNATRNIISLISQADEEETCLTQADEQEPAAISKAPADYTAALAVEEKPKFAEEHKTGIV